MFSQTVEYALRAVVHLASIAPQAQTIEQIACATRVPPSYLAKVLQALRRGEVVQSQRGANGGIRLIKSPDQLTILEVVNAVEPIQRINTCPLQLASHGKRLCPLHKRMDEAIEKIEQSFRQTTVAEVLGNSTGSIPLCDFPSAAINMIAPAD